MEWYFQFHAGFDRQPVSANPIVIITFGTLCARDDMKLVTVFLTVHIKLIDDITNECVIMPVTSAADKDVEVVHRA
jgi:hypothetical protein